MKARRKDRKMFRKTASTTKRINVLPKIVRGGTCR